MVVNDVLINFVLYIKLRFVKGFKNMLLVFCIIFLCELFEIILCNFNKILKFKKLN